MKKRKSIWKRILPVLVICVISSCFATSQAITMTLAKHVTAELDLTANVANKAEISDPFFANDSQKVWTDKEIVDIFKLSYDENGDVTVRSAEKDAVVAPGTSGSYYFRINNTTTKTMDCKVMVRAWMSNDQYKIPILAKWIGMDHTFFVGSEGAYADVLDLDGVSDTLTLDGKHYFSYELAWTWPFESSQDEWDTLLGNQTIQDDISLTIEITTYATYDDTEESGEESNSGNNGKKENSQSENNNSSTESKQEPTHSSNENGAPYTGETLNLALWLSIAIGSFMVLVFMLIFPWGRDDDDDDEEQESVA